MIATRSAKGISALRANSDEIQGPPLASVSGESFMTNGNGAPPEQAPPQLNVLAQYTKDLSFENPNAPGSLAPQQPQARSRATTRRGPGVFERGGPGA